MGRRQRRGDGDCRIVLDAPAGPVRAVAREATNEGRTARAAVSFRNVPSFVLAAGVPLQLAGRIFTADVAFGGAFYAIVDAEAAGLSIDPAKLGELKRVGMAIARDVERLVKVVHPAEPGLTGIYGTIFTAPARADGAHLRNVTVFADAEVDRSPCGTGTAAVMAVLDEMGVLGGRRALRAREHHRHLLQRPGRRPHPRRRSRRHRPGDHRQRLDHRRAHVPGRWRRPAARRVQDLNRAVIGDAMAGRVTPRTLLGTGPGRRRPRRRPRAGRGLCPPGGAAAAVVAP